jgi:hypothetical protein
MLEHIYRISFTTNGIHVTHHQQHGGKACHKRYAPHVAVGWPGMTLLA